MTTNPIGPSIRRTERATHLVILMVVLSLVLPLLLWPGIAALVWTLRPDNHLDLVVYDQTVPDASYLEHASLGLVLEYEKVPFVTDDSFVGAAPGGAPHGTWPEEAPDLVMLVDAYGVYVDDGGEVSDLGSNRITDAFGDDDADRVIGWAETGTVVYGEFNVLAEPTASPVSLRLEELFGVTSTRWAGRPFADLAEVPTGLMELAGGTWDFSGRGIVLLASGPAGGSVVVLTADELTGSLPIVYGELPGSGRTTEARVDGWFEVITAAPGTEVDLRMRLPVSEAGRALLGESGIPVDWPFLVRREKSLYLAADASENSVDFPLRKMTGSAVLMRALPQAPHSEFFYQVYVPVVQWLVETAEATNG